MTYNKKKWVDHIVDQNGSVIQQGTPLSSGNLNNMENGIANAHIGIDNNVEAIREAICSGFTKLGDIDYSYMSTNPNTIRLSTESVAFVNGYKVAIPDGTVINLDAPPIEGKREDLVFLEVWKSQATDTEGEKVSWRLRTVANVDFNTYPEGFKIYGAPWNGGVCAQGGNGIPQGYVSSSPGTTAFHTRKDNSTMPDDGGLYRAGLGSVSKNILITADGYVYAIPMFRVLRRNSGGYSVRNGNGSSLFKYIIGVKNKNIPVTNSIAIVTSSDIIGFDGLIIGEKYEVDPSRSSGKSYYTVVSKDSVSATLLYSVPNTNSSMSADTKFILKTRNDYMLSDIVYERDIIDLRHQVSLTGFNYQQLLEENFDKLLRGELQTKEKTKMLKTYHGIPKTPIDNNTVFYASFDGSVIAEVGGNPVNTLNSYSFKNSPTGLGIYYPSSVSGKILAYNLSTPINVGNKATVDFIITNYSKGRLFKIGGLFGYDYSDGNIYISRSGEDVHFPIYKLSNNIVNHIRLRFVGNIVYVIVNGTLMGSLSWVSDIVDIKLFDYAGDGGSVPNYLLSDLSISNIDRGSVFATLPHDFIDGYAKIMPAFNKQRQIQSDAFTSEYKCEVIKANGDNGKHFTKTQATSGIWTSGDTLKVKGLCGEIITGCFNNVALAKIIDISDNSSVAYVDDISKISIGDSVNLMLPSGEIGWVAKTITAIDIINKSVTFDSPLTNGSILKYGRLLETTPSTSSPVIGLNGVTPIIGTWSGLGTKEATFTFGTNASLTNQNVTIEYCLNEVEGQGGIPEVLSNVLGGEYGGKKLIVNPATHIVDDFKGKVSGSVVENPNKSQTTSTSSLLVPSAFNYENSTHYNLINSLDGAISPYGGTSVNGAIPQQLFSFNIIEIIERKFGKIPADTVSGKVFWIKNNLSSIQCNWYGYGSCPIGNKAYFKVYANNGYIFWGDTNGITTNTSSTPTKLGTPLNSDYSIGKAIDDNGFVHFLAYTDKARTTDEVLLVLSNHGLKAWDIIENTTLGYAMQVNSSVTTNTVSLVSSLTGQTAGNSIRKYHRRSDTTINAVNGSVITVNNHGLSTGDIIMNNTRNYAKTKVTVIDANSFTCDTPINGIAGGDSIATYNYYGTQIAESTVISSTIYTDYINIEITFRTPIGYDVLAPENPRRDDGLSNMLFVRKETKEIQVVFSGVDNNKGVVTYGDYVPYQGISYNLDNPLFVHDRIFATTSGTGGVQQDISNVNISRKIFSYLLGCTKTEKLNNVSIMGISSNASSGGNYALIPTIGIRQNTRGIFLCGNIGMGNKEIDTSKIARNTYILFCEFALVCVGGELQIFILGIISYIDSNGKVQSIENNNPLCNIKLSGRPLMK